MKLKSTLRYEPGQVYMGVAGNNHTPLALEFKARAGIFTRADSSVVHPTSYQAPTWSSSKGMIEAILFHDMIFVNPLAVEILAPIRFMGYSFNYGGELRKSAHIRKGDNAQYKCQVLYNPHFRIIFDVSPSKLACRGFDRRSTVGHYVERLQQLVQNGNHQTVGMGVRDFPTEISFATTAQPIRQTFRIGLMLKRPAYLPGEAVEYFQDVWVRDGVLCYPFDQVVEEPGRKGN